MRAASLAAAALVAAGLWSGAADAQPLRLGVWTAGHTDALFQVTAAGGFLEKQGLSPQFVRFGDVNGQIVALAHGDVDALLATSSIEAVSFARKGADFKTVLAVSTARDVLAAKAGGAVRAPADLAGKRLGLLPPGSSTYTIVMAVLRQAFHLDPQDIARLPCTDLKCAAMLVHDDVDAVVVHEETADRMAASGVRPLIDLGGEWGRLHGHRRPPVVGVAVVGGRFLADRPDAVAALVRGLRAAIAWGGAHPREVAAVLTERAGYSAQDAAALAAHWAEFFVGTLNAEDVEVLRQLEADSVAAGVLDGPAPAGYYDSGPFDAALR